MCTALRYLRPGLPQIPEHLARDSSVRHTGRMNSPSWLLLLWAGCAATCSAAVAGTVLGGAARGTWSLAPRVVSRARNVAWTLGGGLLLYPLIYGVLFELLHTDRTSVGLIIGSVHAGIVVALNSPNRNHARAISLAGMHIVYGVMIAFLYVVP